MKAKNVIRDINRRGIIVYLTSFTSNKVGFAHNSGFLRTRAEAFARLNDGDGSGGIQRIEKVTYTFDRAKVIVDHDLQEWTEEDIKDFVFHKSLFDEDKEPESIELVFEQKIERS